MASVNHHAPPNEARQYHHQRSKSNVLSSFMHRRNNSDGSLLQPADLRPASTFTAQPPFHHNMPPPILPRPAALGEIQNQAGAVPRAPTTPNLSPTKTGFFGKTVPPKDTSKSTKKAKDDAMPGKPKKTKSSTNLAALLTRPKSLKNLHKGFSEDEVNSKNKENQTPPSSTSSQDMSRPPIYAQFSSGALERSMGLADNSVILTHAIATSGAAAVPPSTRKTKERPKSYHATYTAPREDTKSKDTGSSRDDKKGSPTKMRGKLGIFTNFGNTSESGSKSPSKESSEFILDPKDVEKHLEAMLDRRNIPENQRYKMRNLADTIKMEFIRQDWAESRGANATRPGSHDSDSSMNGRQEIKENEKQSRGRSFTLTRNRGQKSESTSPVKKSKGEGTLGRHFRARSTESVASERPESAGSSAGNGILSKMKLHQNPMDYVTYLRKVQRPENVEVGKLHKLRLLLRNETVAWTEDFIRQGGMQEIVALLHRIMEVEWREEHEDALLHEALLCLKALCTTACGVQYLHSVQATLFRALLDMLFDPEKKGPSDFTTRMIITSVLFTYIQSASPQDRPIRAKTVLGHLRDTELKEEDRPPAFVLEMRRERPYRIWCKEFASVTKEVFWIYLHHVNVVYLAPEKKRHIGDASGIDAPTYMKAHFPQERVPVPAAPFVGGVEWDATNYLTSHLDLVNAILACTPTAEERNALRELLRISGWEHTMGFSLRTCKEKFYAGIHDGLRTWVAAAAEDGWDARDVRYGPPAPRSPVKKQGGGKQKPEEPAPKIEMPKLDFGHGGSKPAQQSENWLS
ncbi:armadillo-type protein [Xylariaceae sp. FL1272]|nr:armadillo-type protein [Xylariaceae sp. FL1272]